MNVFGVRIDLRGHRLLGISFFIPSAPNPPMARGRRGGDELSDAEIAGILDEAFTEILADTLPPVIAYEKLSGEIIADYAEGGAR